MRVRLSSNESMFGVSPAAIAAAQQAAGELHLYPDDQAVALRQALAEDEGTDMASVSIGIGSSGILMDLVASQCSDGQGSVLSYDRAFIVYRLASRNAGVRYVEAPTAGPATRDASGYARDPQALLDAIDDSTRVVIVDNPGNPTGAHLDADGLRAVVEGVPEHVVLLIDEAYWQYGAGHAGYARVRELDVTHPKLIVTSTFSKAHALAGLRIGYVTGATDVVQRIDGWRPRFNANSIGQAAALASLADTDHMAATVRQTVEQRRRTAEGLRALGIPFTDGLGNFLTFELGTEAGPVVEAFASRGVGIRPLAPYGMSQQIRVSIGLPTDTDDFLTAAADVLADVPARV
jgi:histidinol-phosphate aminotransferase